MKRYSLACLFIMLKRVFATVTSLTGGYDFNFK
jgi:hypothetical protein